MNLFFADPMISEDTMISEDIAAERNRRTATTLNPKHKVIELDYK